MRQTIVGNEKNAGYKFVGNSEITQIFFVGIVKLNVSLQS